jgi:NTE family protein
MNRSKSVANSLVLGGGGVAGIAWMTGLLFGLQKQGLDLSGFDLVVGTSAGSAVGAQLYSGLPMEELQERQIEPARQVHELVPRISMPHLFVKFIPALLARKKPQTFRQRIGRMAMNASTVAPEERYRVIEERLPSQQWPSVEFKVVVVNARSGDMEVLDQGSGVSLTDAVAASCAVPGIWPVVELNGIPYIDGGVRSATNADLAAGSDKVLVLAPMGYHSFLNTGSHLREEVDGLEAAGSRVHVLVPDAESTAAIGRNPLAPESRAPSALAGEQQAITTAASVMALFDSQ